MSIRRQLLRPVAFVAGLHASRQAGAFARAHRRCRTTQQTLLERLIARHAETAFGRDHAFARIGSYQDFVKAVPLRTYEDLRPYVDRVYNGETTALLPPGEALLMFCLTSGTTGRPKRIPVTARFLAELKRGSNIFGSHALKAHPASWLRPILQVTSPVDDYYSPAGIPCGAISGMIMQTQKAIVRRMYVVPYAVSKIADPRVRFYTILRCSVPHHIAFIATANPSSQIKLADTAAREAARLIRDLADGTFTPPGEVGADIRAHLRLGRHRSLARRMEAGLAADGRLLPRHFWNLDFLANWTGGTLQLYQPRVRELFGHIPIRDIGLLASEGRFSIPVADETPSGLAEVISNVLEFIPADQHDRANPDVLPAADVEVGGEYFLVVSNSNGLWRYCLDDRVRITGRLGEGPVFEFLCRGTRTVSMTGEKVTEKQVVEAMRRASDAAGVPVDRFVVQGCFAATPYYQLRLDAVPGLDVDALARGFDAALADLNIEYRSKRSGDRLGPPRCLCLSPGTLDQAEESVIRQRHGHSEQYKHQYLLTEVLAEAK
ncbi:MAG: GH3 auxin-responsive promoter family protein [Planctomycetota bacterium]|nr:GH3 auxin-responsive promoter family protein [Planctomycetota bacterium]